MTGLSVINRWYTIVLAFKFGVRSFRLGRMVVLNTHTNNVRACEEV